jgi:hypothetical protein
MHPSFSTLSTQSGAMPGLLLSRGFILLALLRSQRK